MLFWKSVFCIVLVCVVLCHGVGVTKNEREVSFDDFADEIRPIGLSLHATPAEAERLKRLYPENERLIANIPSRYFEVIYPVQVRQHQKLGISTRDAAANKTRETGKHFHSTSLLVKAFNYKFRLDLELNTNLLAPNLIQKHFLPEGAQQISTQEIEQCYYHGTIKEYPGGMAALRTCNGVSGVIHVGNETFVIHPFYGGDLSRKHPHVLYRFFPENKGKHTCGNSGMHEWGFKQFRIRPPTRIKKDVRQVNKYIELALIIDQAMFESRNSSRAEVVNDAIQILNCVDMYFRTVNTRVSVLYVETWAHGDQIEVTADVRQTLFNLVDYTSRKLYQVSKDATHLITGRHFRGSEVGMAVPDSICTAKAVGVSEDTNIYEPQLVASTITHMLGHNVGMGHDVTDGTPGPEECKCQDWWGCIMSQNILGESKIQPYHFSTCSVQDYIRALRVGHGICLFNKPNQLEDFQTCGNGLIEEGEQCDCGSIEDCLKSDPCCDPITCKLRVEADCSSGPCCENCKLRPPGYLCRPPTTECDIPEFCDGRAGQCPSDLHRKNGSPCNNAQGFCYFGDCPTPDSQCDYLWGFGAIASEKECFVRFNTQGSLNGNCGTDSRGGYVKCSEENVRCGSLQCQRGSRTPLIPGMDKQYSRTIVYLGGSEYECKAVQKFDTSHSNKTRSPNFEMPISSGMPSVGSTMNVPDIPDLGMVRDGTKCAEDRVCVNQTCVSVDRFIEPGNCPTNNVAYECSGHGVCSSLNSCYCDRGWTGFDCSRRADERVHPGENTNLVNPASIFTTPEAVTAQTPVADWRSKTFRSAFEVATKGSLSTTSLVIVLVTIVGGVFIFFALLATCYRRSSLLPKGASAYLKKRFGKKLHMPLAGKKDDGSSQENVNRIITFGSMPSYREDKLQELRRSQQDTPPPLPPPAKPTATPLEAQQRLQKQQQQQQQLQHQMVEDNSTFVELSPDNLSRVPEKGILKHGRLDAWEDSPQEEQGSDAQSDVERTLKTINGYHEEILEALHTASQRMGDSKRSPSSEDGQRKNIADIEYAALSLMKSAQEQRGSGGGGTCDSSDEPCPIRIRNLEDLLRQLEHHPPVHHQHDQDPQHTSPAHSDEIRLSEPEADRHYLLGGPDGRSDGKADSSLQYLLGRLQAGSASVKSAAMTHRSKTGRYSVEEDEMLEDEDDDADDASGEDDEDGSTYSSHHLVRSASEEALPVTTGVSSSGGGKDYAYPRKSRPRQSSRDPPCDYVPSPQPSEDSYANSSEDNAFLPANIPPAPRAGRAPKIQPLPQGPAATSTGSLPSSSKRKPRKKSPEYKV